LALAVIPWLVLTSGVLIFNQTARPAGSSHLGSDYSTIWLKVLGY